MQSAMRDSSDHPNVLSMQKVRIAGSELKLESSYYPDMARKQVAPTAIGPDWFLVDWMRSLKVTQAKLGRETGWSKATVNDIYHGKTGYYRQIVNEAARALHIQPYELLMHPDEAMAIRRMRESALRIAAETKPDFSGEPSNIRRLGSA